MSPPDAILDLPMTRVDGTTTSVRVCLEETDTDAFVVMHGGSVVAQWYRTPEDEVAEHALMSITKSVIGCVAGVLIADGSLEPDLPAAHYVPELAYGSYAHVSVRDLLDMRTAGTAHPEDYIDPHGELARIAAAVEEPWPGLPAPLPGAHAPATLRDVVATAVLPPAPTPAPAPPPPPVALDPVPLDPAPLDVATPHQPPSPLDTAASPEASGEQSPLPPTSPTSPTPPATARPFCYRSLDTEALAWVLERAAGRPILDLVAELLAPLQLEAPGSIAIDATGVPQASGGLGLRARDVARFALMVLHGGAAGETQVVPSTFVKDTRTGGPDSAEAMLARVDHVLGPGAGLAARGGFYRNQFWVPSKGARALLCLGIHGQLALVDSDTDTVVVKLSTWPTAQNPVHFTDGLTCAQTIAHHLGGRDPSARRGRAASAPAPLPSRSP